MSQYTIINLLQVQPYVLVVGGGNRYESKQDDSSLSWESKNHLTLLKRMINDKIAMMEEAIVRKDDDDEVDGSGSGSGSGETNGNEISESGCGEDDEDCGSTSSGEIPNRNVIGTGLYSWCAHSESSVNYKSNEQLESQITTVVSNEKNVENEAQRKDIETHTDLIESKDARFQSDQSVVALVKQYEMRIEEL
ncbi:hypothetical protein AWC38_SpisGene13235 [Stylophora pistillata]|uniref:Uncharacterized protein n=1 Tax=Stylophora pistillata TaxID=50429 RepID=A0A2B4S0X9_STYPI|nr:hypothetical protein AWC38_SpisGene13235 [Stylophora pistillata]